MSIAYGRMKVIDSPNFINTSLNKRVKALNLSDFRHPRKALGEKWELFTEKQA